MSLNEAERRELDEIGCWLAAEDPVLAQHLSAPPPRAPGRERSRGWAFGWSMLVVGLVLLIPGAVLHTAPLLITGLFLMMLFPVPIGFALDRDTQTDGPGARRGRGRCGESE